MSVSKATITILAAIAAAALGAASAHAQADPVRVPLDGEQVVGDVQVGCTGIGQEKGRPALEGLSDPRRGRQSGRRPAGQHGGQPLRKDGGAVLASVKCAGPWIMLRPPPGVYTLEGWLRGGSPHQVMTVSPPASGQKIVTLIFPRS